MQPLFDNLTVIKDQFKKNDKKNLKINELLDEKKLLITPLIILEEEVFKKHFLLLMKLKTLLHMSKNNNH